jgi:hypothetical protein
MELRAAAGADQRGAATTVALSATRLGATHERVGRLGWSAPQKRPRRRVCATATSAGTGADRGADGRKLGSARLRRGPARRSQVLKQSRGIGGARWG